MIDKEMRLAAFKETAKEDGMQVTVFDPPKIDTVGEFYGGDEGLYEVHAEMHGDMAGPFDTIVAVLACKPGGTLKMYSI